MINENVKVLFKKFSELFDIKKAKMLKDSNYARSVIDGIKSMSDFEAEMSGYSFTCKKGCGHCCHKKIMATKVESKIIAEYVKENNIPYDKDLLKKQADNYLNLSENDWWALDDKDGRCVFLNEKKECSIYPVRPIECHYFRVVSEPIDCSKEKNGASVDIFTELNGATIIFAFNKTFGGKKPLPELMKYRLLGPV